MSENSILSRLDGLKIKYEEIGQQMTDPEVIADMKKFVKNCSRWSKPAKNTGRR